MTVYLIYLTTYCFNLFSNCTRVQYGDYRYIFLFWKFLFLDANQQLLLYEEHCLSVLGLLSPRAIVYIWAMNDNLDIWILAQPPIKALDITLVPSQQDTQAAPSSSSCLKEVTLVQQDHWLMSAEQEDNRPVRCPTGSTQSWGCVYLPKISVYFLYKNGMRVSDHFCSSLGY